MSEFHGVFSLLDSSATLDKLNELENQQSGYSCWLEFPASSGSDFLKHVLFF